MQSHSHCAALYSIRISEFDVQLSNEKLWSAPITRQHVQIDVYTVKPAWTRPLVLDIWDGQNMHIMASNPRGRKSGAASTKGSTKTTAKAANMDRRGSLGGTQENNGQTLSQGSSDDGYVFGLITYILNLRVTNRLAATIAQQMQGRPCNSC